MRASDTESSYTLYITSKNVILWTTLFTKIQKNDFDLIPKGSIISNGGFFNV